MHETIPARLPDRLKAAFGLDEPAGLRALGVVSGILPGRAWVDDVRQPSTVLLQESTFGTIYLAGRWQPEPLANMIAQLRKHGEVMIGLWPDDPRAALLPPQADYTGIVHDFYDNPPAARLNALLQTVPEGCELRPIDATIFGKLMSKDDLIRQYGSVENTLQTILGVCLLHEGQSVCEAITSPIIQGIREVGIDTRADSRRRSYATLTCAALLQLCERQGCQTFWNCNSGNTPSLALARRLGYQRERQYQLTYWNQVDP